MAEPSTGPHLLSSWKYRLLFCIILAFIILESFINGRRTQAGSDFHVFWTAGHNFIYGNDLYSGIGGACRFIYPPFAAMLFQLFALLPMKIAAGIFTFVNFILFAISIYLSREILSLYINDQRKIAWSLLFGAACSFRFFWYHTLFVQMNELVLVLCLYAVLASLRGKQLSAAVCMVIAIFIKILPVFFLPWLLLRGNYKTVLYTILCILSCLFLPWLWRSGMGWQDLQHYYTSFLGPFKEGRVEPEFHNQSLAAAIYKLCLPSTDPGYSYRLFNISQRGAALIYKLSFVLLGLLLMCYLLWERYKLKANTLNGLALIFLVMHLLSGITWEYHLVSLLFVYAIFGLYYRQMKTLPGKVLYFGLGFLMVLFSIVGKDTVGTFMYHYLEGFSVITWLMLALVFFFAFIGNKYRPTTFIH